MNQKERMKREYPYRGISDRKYIKEKRAFLKKNGNGWWWGQDKDKDKEETVKDKVNE